MLPDYPEFKEEILRIFIRRIKKVEQRDTGPLYSNAIRLHEGIAIELIREDGKIENIKMKEYRSEFRISNSDLETGSIENIFEIAEEQGRSLAGHKVSIAIDAIDKVTESTGNVVSTNGKTMTPDHIIALFEKIEIGFSPNGKPQMPGFITGEETEPQIRAAIAKMACEPYISRFEELMRYKKEKWHEKEANRKLVR